MSWVVFYITMPVSAFKPNLSSHLYRVWNRLSSGSYYPPRVNGVELPMRGGTRRLGVLTVADRVAQGTSKSCLKVALRLCLTITHTGIVPDDLAAMSLR